MHDRYYSIEPLDSPDFDLLATDPVRPGIPREFRVALPYRGVYLLRDPQSHEVQSLCCWALPTEIPSSESDLVSSDLYQHTKDPEICVFYTVWSLVRSGSAGLLLDLATAALKQKYPTIESWVTLSPPTEMARRFHISRGAEILRENPETINYIYRENLHRQSFV